MAKKAYVYSGTDWVPLASEVTDLTAYSTSTEIANTYATKAENGLVHISTTDFSASSSESFDNVFSATYNNYKIFMSVNSSIGTVLNLRLRVSGSDATSTNYVIQRFIADGTSLTGARVTSTTARITGLNGSPKSRIELNLFNPFETDTTGFMSNSQYPYADACVEMEYGNHTLSTSYDGFTIYPSTGTITGTISIYAIKD